MEQALTLRTIIDKIREQQQARGADFKAMSFEARKHYASECAHALFVEVGELSASWPFASWKTGVTDVENIKREIIDCIFFLVNIALCFDITTEDLEAMFKWVLNNNAQRIANGEHKEVSNGL